MAVSTAYKHYALAMMTAVVTFNYIDRCLITVLLQPIKDDLALSDTQMGLLTGIAFAFFYATLGLPIARWADRGNRVTITSLAIGLWGLTVMACLWVGNFVQLLLARIAASVGESGCMPPTYSLVGDYFPGAAERTRAMSIYMLAAPLATLISFVLGGWLNDHYGWRVAFFLFGVPALLIAVLVKWSIAEPLRQGTQAPLPLAKRPRTADVFKHLWYQRSARHLTLGIILFWTLGLGLMPWYGAFMIRSHGMTTTELGLWLGLIIGVSGGCGILLGGYVAGRWFAGNERGQMRLIAAMVVSLVPWYALYLLLPQKYLALFAFIPLVTVFNCFMGPIFALLQRLVADEMRATTFAVVMLLANLIGMGIGPLIVGTLSDVLSPMFGADALRYAMLIMAFTALWAAYHFWQVGETVMKNLSLTMNRGSAC